MKLRTGFAALLASTMLSLLAGQARSAPRSQGPTQPLATIVWVTGKGMHTDPGAPESIALPGATVPAGTLLRTESDSALELTISTADGEVIAHLAAQTSVVIDTTADPLHWKLRKGELVVSSAGPRRNTGSTLVIETPDGAKTRWNGEGRIDYRTERSSVSLTIETLTGNVNVVSPSNRTMVVQTGSMATFDNVGKPTITPLNPNSRAQIASITTQMRANAARCSAR